MPIWTSRGSASGLALAAALLLGACDETTTAELFAAPGAASEAAGKRTGGFDAVIGGGRIALTAPAGFCIDPQTLDATGREGFALMARCDRLAGGQPSGLPWQSAPALITVTTRPRSGGGGPISAADLAGAYPALTVLERRDGPPAALIRATGRVPALPGVDPVHWRGAFVTGDQVVVLGFFAPPGSAALGQGGAGVLTQLARRIARDSALIAAR